MATTTHSPRPRRSKLPNLPDTWKFLESGGARPHALSSQVYVKGSRLRAATVWRAMLANELTEEQAASNWDIPREAIQEIVRYCEMNLELLADEAQEEWRRVEEAGVKIEPSPPR